MAASVISTDILSVGEVIASRMHLYITDIKFYLQFEHRVYSIGMNSVSITAVLLNWFFAS